MITLHLAAQHWNDTDANTAAWQIFNLYDCAVRWCVPVFFMISGALFLDPDREVPVRRVYTHYLPRIICAFLFWTVVYAVERGLLNGFSGISKQLILGHYHMWFLFAIAGLYIITPLVRMITVSEEMTRYFLVLWLVSGILIPRLLSIDELLGDFPFSWLLTALNTSYTRMWLHLTVGYVGYYVLGYHLRKRNLPSSVIWGGILGLLIACVLSGVISVWKNEQTDYFYSYLSVPVLLESVAVFSVGKQKLSKIRSPRLDSLVKMLSRYSFGIYLVHPLVIELLRTLGLHTLTFSPILSVPILAVIVFAISAAISAALNHIPVLKNYIV